MDMNQEVSGGVAIDIFSFGMDRCSSVGLSVDDVLGNVGVEP